MSLPSQAVHAGVLEQAYRRELDNMVAGEAIRRLWAKDLSLWPASEQQSASLSSNLTWLDLPEKMGPYMSRVAEFADAVEADGFQDAVFVGMGDANLAAEVVEHLAIAKRWKRLFVLDSTDPSAVQSVHRQLNYERTLFIFASKSGKQIESHALLLYFLEQLRARGVSAPGRQFVAVTEENSYLASLAGEYQFRGVFFDPPGISGRYSALIHFGLLLSGLCRLSPATLLFTAASMNELCRQAELGEGNPALSLAALLAAGANSGNDRLLLFGTTSLAALTNRVGQLVGVSTSKGGRGLIPISVEAAWELGSYAQGCLAAIFRLHGDEDSGVEEATKKLKATGIPCVAVELSTAEEFGAELFKWEVATALTCALLEVNPFDEPELRQGASATAEIVARLATKRGLPASTVRVREAGIELYAEGKTRQQISTLSLSEALRTFFEGSKPDGYVATLAFLERSATLRKILVLMGEQLSSRLGIPSVLSFGPRYLHHLGQVFQGGPAKGRFLILTGEPAEDIAIPGAGYSFGQLQLALAMGDFESLERYQKPVVRLHLMEGVEQGLTKLEQILQQALRNIRGGKV